MQRLNQLWTKLSGAKTVIGSLLAVLYAWALAQGLMERNEAIEALIATVGVLGFGHKAVKATR